MDIEKALYRRKMGTDRPDASMDILNEIRERMRYSWAQVASHSRIPKVTIFRLKRGDVEALSYKHFNRLLHFYCYLFYKK